MPSASTLQPPAPRHAAPDATPAVCAHCALPVPLGLVRPAEDRQFCCQGCESAYRVIHQCGLERFYAIRDQADGAAAPAGATGRTFAEFDDDTFRRLHVTRTPDGLCRAELFLSGVHCAACVWLVERLPRFVPGVVEARVDLGRALVHLTWNDERVPLSRIARALDSIGYAPSPAREAAARARRRAEDRRQLARLAVAGACAGNVMLFAVALYAGVFGVMEPAHRELFRWASMLLTVVSLAWPGRVFFTSALAALRARAPHFDVPIALALGAGGAWSIWSTVTGAGEVYFDTVSVLVFALLVGRFFQARQQRSAADAVELLFSLTPASARRVPAGGGEPEDVPVEALAPGDIVEVRAGECLPADGVVTAGHSAIDQGVLTGESRPVDIAPGREVAAGTINVGAAIRVRVEATGEGTRVAKLMRLVEDGARRRAPIVRFADRVAGAFTVGMLALAVITFGVWLVLDPPHALDHAVALLVVTCPCALGLATPLVITIAMGRAARGRMLVKGGDCLQRLSTPGTILLDKTGTITLGGLAPVAWAGEDLWRAPVASLEAHSNHPVAVALRRDVPAEDLLPATDVVHTVGGGIEGVVGGQRVVVGSPAFVRARTAAARPPRTPAESPAEADLVRELSAFAARGLTPVAVAVDDVLVAGVALGDRVRPGSAAAIGQLRALGWNVRMLSGDHPDVAQAVGREVGLLPADIHAGLSPEDKLAHVQSLGARGGCPVVMVGDGVNDAAALAAADVGVAVHGGVEASLAAADVYLGTPGLAPLVELVTASRRTMTVIRRNLWVSLFYNVTAGTLAVLGLVNPIVAALVMPLSSITALSVSLRSRTFGGRP
ncbi:MAG: heavy metal translocating P-type ATPase [Planctomycetota bacterium]|nr:heavy metal translocating P-type ATPase [Planctomycetota bacterium]